MGFSKSPERRPRTIRDLHGMESFRSSIKTDISLHQELLQHSRYIRDFLVTLLDDKPCLPASELALLSSVVNRVATVPMTIELLRFSHIEKALKMIAHTSQECWPVDLVLRAERLLKKWEDELGPEVHNVEQDFFGPGGRLEGLKENELSVGEREFESSDRLWWASNIVETLRPYEMGHAGFEVGAWYLNPCAAHLAGIIGNPTLSITTSTPPMATAVLLTGTSEELLHPFDGTRLRYHHRTHEPDSSSLRRTLLSVSEKWVRLLRSHKLQSPLAPRAGVRYDGLYRIQGYGVKLTPPNDWTHTFVLERTIADQPPLGTILAIPASDQFDDWQSYLRMLVTKYGREAAGSAIWDLESDVLTPTSSVDSRDRDSPRSGSNGKASFPHPDPQIVASQVVVVASSSSTKALETWEDQQGEVEVEEHVSDKELARKSGSNDRYAKEGGQKQVSAPGQRDGTVALASQVIAVRNTVKREKGKASSEGNGFQRFGRKLGL